MKPSPIPALIAAALAVSLAQTIVIAALPTLGRQLTASPTEVTWVLTAFMLASAISTPLAGRLGDLFGYRNVLIASLSCFVVGSTVAALATGADSLPFLITGRAIQGLAGGVFPVAFGIARQSVPARRLPGVVALLSAMFGIGGSAGMVLAGPIVDGLGTVWLFWGPLLIVLVPLAMIRLVPGGRPSRGGRVDLVGAALLSGTVVGLLLGISQARAWGWSSPRILGLFATTLVVAGLFVVHQLRTRDPLVDLRLMRRPALAVTNTATLILAVAMFGALTMMPQYLQTPGTSGYGPGLSVTATGIVMIPMAMLILAASPLATRIRRRLGARAALQVGAGCAVIAYVGMALAHDHPWQFYVTGGVVGVAYGLGFAAIGNLTVEAVDAHHTGVATGINTIVRTVGAALGAQLAAVLVAGDSARPGGFPAESQYTAGFIVFAVVALGSLATASMIPASRTTPDDGGKDDTTHNQVPAAVTEQ